MGACGSRGGWEGERVNLRSAEMRALVCVHRAMYSEGLNPMGGRVGDLRKIETAEKS